MSEELSSQAEQLKGTIGFFKIRGVGGSQEAGEFTRVSRIAPAKTAGRKSQSHTTHSFAAGHSKGNGSGREKKTGMTAGIALNLSESGNGADADFERF